MPRREQVIVIKGCLERHWAGDSPHGGGQVIRASAYARASLHPLAMTSLGLTTVRVADPDADVDDVPGDADVASARAVQRPERRDDVDT